MRDQDFGTSAPAVLPGCGLLCQRTLTARLWLRPLNEGCHDGSSWAPSCASCMTRIWSRAPRKGQDASARGLTSRRRPLTMPHVRMASRLDHVVAFDVIPKWGSDVRQPWTPPSIAVSRSRVWLARCARYAHPESVVSLQRTCLQMRPSAAFDGTRAGQGSQPTTSTGAAHSICWVSA